MSERELERYRRQLMALGLRMKDDISSLTGEGLRTAGGEASGNLSNTPLHLADLGSDSFEHEVTMNLLETEGQVYAAIAAALGRLENGTFGRCERCGKDIGRERLEALPYLPLCIDCARAEQPPPERAAAAPGVAAGGR